MKVLTLWQPHASLCVLVNPATGKPYKTIETRSWSTSYRGPLAIHAAASENWREGQRVGEWTCYRTSKTHRARMYCRAHRPLVVALPLGAIVATCRLVDVVPVVDRGHGIQAWGDGSLWHIRPVVRDIDLTDQRPYGDFTPGRFAFLLADIEPVDPPVPFKGGQGLTKTWESVPV